MKKDPRVYLAHIIECLHKIGRFTAGGKERFLAEANLVTISTKGQARLFGEVRHGEMRLDESGQIVERTPDDLPNHVANVELDAFVVMPNHVHGIIMITRDVGAKDFSPPQDGPKFRSPSKTIGSIIRGFKTGVTKWFRQNSDVWAVWQRNYYEHVIRNDASLNRIRQYVLNNPARWAFDRENPAAVRPEPPNAWLRRTNPPS